MSTDEANPADRVAAFERERAELMRALTPVLAAAGVPKPAAHAPEVVEYLRRLGFAVSTTGVPVDAATTNRYLAVALDITIAEAGGAPPDLRDRNTHRPRPARGAGPRRAAPRASRTGMALMPPVNHHQLCAPIAPEGPL